MKVRLTWSKRYTKYKKRKRTNGVFKKRSSLDSEGGGNSNETLRSQGGRVLREEVGNGCSCPGLGVECREGGK